jgi:membrane protein
MKSSLSKINDFLENRLWTLDLRNTGLMRGAGTRLIRFFYLMILAFTDRELSLRAASLVYTSLLSLIPFLAVSFSMLKAFGAHTMLEEFLIGFLAPLGPEGKDLAIQTTMFVDNLNVGVLGSVGLIFLLYKAVSLMYELESALNHIWAARNTKTPGRRFVDYLTVLLVGPLLILTATGITVSFMSTSFIVWLQKFEPFSTAILIAGELLPYVMAIAACTLVFAFLPNRKVGFFSALAGGVFAGVLWQFAGLAFAAFTVTSSQYSAIYSGFAFSILFLIWLQLSWLILLAGARLSFHYQYPGRPHDKKSRSLASRENEKIAMLIMFLATRTFKLRQPLTLEKIFEHLDLPLTAVQAVLSRLVHKRLLLEGSENPPTYVPAVDPDSLTLQEVLDALGNGRKTGEGKIPEVDALMTRMDDCLSAFLGAMTISELTAHSVPQIMGMAGKTSESPAGLSEINTDKDETG